MKIIIINNTSASGGKGVVGIHSGNERILVECSKRWMMRDDVEIDMMITADGLEKCQFYGLDRVRYTVWQTKSFLNFPGTISWNFINTLVSFRKALSLKIPNDSSVFVISASEFPADFIPGLILKLRFRKIRWIAGFYLFAPNITQNVYKGAIGKLKNVLWYVTQTPSYYVIKKYADMIWVTNDDDNERFVSQRLSQQKVITVAKGVDIDLPKMVPKVETTHYDAVFLGRFHPQKGILELLDIWRLVCNDKKNARLAVVGIGWLENEIKEKISRLNLDNNVEMLGFKDGLEKIKVFRDSRIMLEPSIYASGGIATYEAMSCGLPTIGYDLEVWRRYFPKGMVVVPANNQEEFAKAILELLSNKTKYDRLSVEAEELAKTVSWDSKAADLLSKVRLAFEM